MWGKSILLNIHGCECIDDIFIFPKTYYIEERARRFFQDFIYDLLKEIDMEGYENFSIDWFGNDHCEGYTVIQKLTTSHLAIHLTENHSVFLDLFSCKDYHENTIIDLVHKWFKCKKISYDIIIRK